MVDIVYTPEQINAHRRAWVKEFQRINDVSNSFRETIRLIFEAKKKIKLHGFDVYVEGSGRTNQDGTVRACSIDDPNAYLEPGMLATIHVYYVNGYISERGALPRGTSIRDAYPNPPVMSKDRQMAELHTLADNTTIVQVRLMSNGSIFTMFSRDYRTCTQTTLKYTMLNDWSILRKIQYKKIKWVQAINGQRHEQWVLHREVCPAITVLGSFFDDDGKMCINTATTQWYYDNGSAIVFNMGNTEYTHLTRDQKPFEYHMGAWKYDGARGERGI